MKFFYQLQSTLIQKNKKKTNKTKCLYGTKYVHKLWNVTNLLKYSFGWFFFRQSYKIFIQTLIGAERERNLLSMEIFVIFVTLYYYVLQQIDDNLLVKSLLSAKFKGLILLCLHLTIRGDCWTAFFQCLLIVFCSVFNMY